MKLIPVLGGLVVLAALASQLRAQTCGDLEDEDSLRSAHIDVIKRAILFKLQLVEEPRNPSGTIVVPQAMLDEYVAVRAAQELVARERVGCVEQPVHPPQFIVLAPLEVLSRSGYHGVFGDLPLNTSAVGTQPPTHLLSFNLNLTDKEIVTSAELRVWYHVLDRNDSKLSTDKQRISIYHVFKQQSDQYFGEDPTHYCTREHVSLERDGYVSFNVTSALRQWLELVEEPRGRLYLEVSVEDLQTSNEGGLLAFQSPAVEISYVDLEGQYSTTTQLLLRAHSIDDDRQRRQVQEVEESANSCSVTSTRNCCKRNLVLDIHRDLQWTWILLPRTLSANFCSGFCPIYWPIATYNTLLRLVQSTRQENPTGSPAPCCVPDKFVSMPFLIFNQTSIELISIDDLSIESCICR